MLHVSPAVADAIPYIGIGVNLLHAAPHEVVVNAVLEVDIQVAVSSLGVADAVHR